MSGSLSSELAALKIERSAPQPARGSRRTMLLIGVGSLVAASFWWLASHLQARLSRKPVTVTEVVAVSRAEETTELTATGYVVAQSSALVASKIPGKVARVFVQRGSQVSAGDILFELEAREQRAAVATAQSRARAALARVVSAESLVTEVQLQADRANELAAFGAGPKSVSEDLKARVASLHAAARLARAEVAAEQSELRAREVEGQNYRAVAPISGTVVNKPPEVGEVVGYSSTGLEPELRGVEIADFSSLEVEADVPEQRLSRIAQGTPCEIVLDAFADKRLRGRVSRVNPRVNRAKATVIVNVRFIDRIEHLLPDMAARVSFLSKELEPSAVQAQPKLVLPSSAVASVAGKPNVFVVEGGLVRMRPVRVGESQADRVVVLSGVAAGTKVVAEPPADLVDGQPIQRKDEE